MLVVTRKEGEKILIPEAGIEIVIARVTKTGAVRVGIKAPEGVKILREELLAGSREAR